MTDIDEEAGSAVVLLAFALAIDAAARVLRTVRAFLAMLAAWL